MSAAGDCSKYNGRLYGLWFLAIEQARIAARNMLKEKSAINQGSKISTSLKVADVIVTSINYDPKTNVEKEEQIKSRTKNLT